MIPFEIQRGRPLTPENYNALVQTVMANRLAPGAGYTVIQTPRGTALAIAPQRGGGGSAGVCPWQVSTANTSPSEWKITIAWGLVGPQGVLPIGMQYDDKPPLTMDFVDGFVVMTVTFKTDSGLIDTVKFEIKPAIPEQSETEAYYPIARISTVTPDGGGDPQQVIQNLCSAPQPSCCDLKFVAAPATP
jgi:hypothetical protein